MTKLKLQYGAENTILRAKAEEISKITPEIKKLAMDMLDALPDMEGVGVAAPQIGISKRLIATTQWKTNKKGEMEQTGEEILINPVIVSKSDKMQTNEEGCLSLPNTFGDVIRHYEVKVEYTNLNGTKKKEKYKGFDAAIMQHEIDHLDGILFVDKVVGKIRYY